MEPGKVPAVPIRYKVDLSRAKQQELDVEMTVELADDAPLDLRLPSFSPGSPTRSQGHAAELSRFGATDAEGRPVPFEKSREGGWTLHPETRGPVTVHYRVKADEFSHVGNHLTEDHAYLHGPATLMYVEGHERDTPAVVEFTNLPDPSWGSLSGLAEVEGQNHAFYATFYEDIADSNFQLGRLDSAEAEVEGTRVVVNRQGTAPWPKLDANGATPSETLEDFSALYKAFRANFGEFPLERYTVAPPRPEGVEQGNKYFINKHYIHTNGSRAGSLEHYHGQELTFKKSALGTIREVYGGDGRAYERGVLAHELVHKLLAKLVRHEGIDSADLQHAEPTDGLWLTEGSTDWMGMVLERQADLLPEDGFIHQMEHIFQRYQEEYPLDPASPTQSSLDAQLGDSSYYNKGAVASFLLDLEIRRLTGGRKSYVDVLRGLKDEFGGSHRTHTLDDIERISRSVAPEGAERIGEFFRDHLRDRKPFDFNRALEGVGMRLVEREDGWEPTALSLGDGPGLAIDEHGMPGLGQEVGRKEKKAEIPALGLKLIRTKGKLKVTGIREGGPAYEAGLAAHSGEKPSRLALSYEGPGGPTSIDLLDPPERVPEGLTLRGLEVEFSSKDPFTGEKITSRYLVEPRPAKRWSVEDVPSPTPEQLALREQWLASL